MKAIFEAIRALRSDMKKEAYASFWSELCYFERRNRGHRHELDEIAVYAAEKNIYCTMTLVQESCTRMETLRFSTRGLLKALGDMPCAQWPRSEAFDGFLTAKDPSGLLLRQLEVLLEWQWCCSMPRPGYRATVSVGSISETELSLKIELWDSRVAGLKAHRQMNFSAPEGEPLNTFKGAGRMYQKATKAIQALFKSMDELPEFSPSARDVAFAAQVTSRFDKALNVFSAEERTWLRQNWARLQHLVK